MDPATMMMVARSPQRCGNSCRWRRTISGKQEPTSRKEGSDEAALIQWYQCTPQFIREDHNLKCRRI